jgi:hypothetical protein
MTCNEIERLVALLEMNVRATGPVKRVPAASIDAAVAAACTALPQLVFVPAAQPGQHA